ncbi:MAG: ribosome biogenesis GTPase Der [Verrucomicrobiae bacterium]|nr:ribosome biogenesis GTPase Der [Verrucomicrobiae bacterium]
MVTIAVVGRPNVGKSLLFNRLARRDVSLVHDQPGVTRDTIATQCSWRGNRVTLVDTGGIGAPEGGALDAMVRREAEFAMGAADVLLWVVDAREGLHPLDASLAKILRRTSKPVVIAANKADESEGLYLDHEFARLGYGDPIRVSAAHGHGIRDLADAVLAAAPCRSDEAIPPGGVRGLRWAIVGRPNVGKSSLINCLVGSSRTLVSEVPGTTRDAVEVPMPTTRGPGGASMLLVDTAGMRKRTRIKDTLEARMTARSVHAINRADLCVLVIDATEGVLEQDRKIAGVIQAASKPLIIAVNKWDIPEAKRWQPPVHARAVRSAPFKRRFEEAVRGALFFVGHAPVVFVSATEGAGMTALLACVGHTAKTLATPIATPALNKTVQEVQAHRPPPTRQGRNFRIYYVAAQQEPGSWRPPRIIGFCNDSRLIADSWLAYLESQLRAKLHLEGIPILWKWRGREEGRGPRKERAPQSRKPTA